jgi:lipopolysaccharide transport system ATP-binding protein
MPATVISVEHLTKKYNLGVISTGTLSRDLNQWWARTRGKPDPYAKVGQDNHNNRIGDSILALNDVSFTVQQGEVLGIIGRNGAGKSTLLKILSQVTAPTSGFVKIKGRVGSLLEVGTGFHPELTGRENVFLNGAILGMRKAEVDRKFDEIVEFSGVEQFIDTPVKRYSSGMYVRLAFAVAAHLDPEILIVDEVLAVGDAAFQKKCLGKMGEVAGEGRTVLFVSHNMATVRNLCKQCVLLYDGEIINYGETEDVVDTYLEDELYVSNHEIPLAKRKDRSGTQVGYYTNVSISYEDQERYSVPMGSDITIEAEFYIARKLNRPVYGIFFKDKNGQTILRAYSHESSVYKPIQSGKRKISCTFYQLPLMFGDYAISLYLGVPKEPIDYIDNVAILKIIPTDIYGTGVLPGRVNSGMCYTKHSWEFSDD